MRISDWSSDVCSSDLIGGGGAELQCWGGCTEQAVLEAVHADARPPRAVDGAPRTGFDAILFETCIAWIAAGEVMEGKPITPENFERLRLARVRLRREIARLKALLREHQIGQARGEERVGQ